LGNKLKIDTEKPLIDTVNIQGCELVKNIVIVDILEIQLAERYAIMRPVFVLIKKNYRKPVRTADDRPVLVYRANPVIQITALSRMVKIGLYACFFQLSKYEIKFYRKYREIDAAIAAAFPAMNMSLVQPAQTLAHRVAFLTQFNIFFSRVIHKAYSISVVFACQYRKIFYIDKSITARRPDVIFQAITGHQPLFGKINYIRTA